MDPQALTSDTPEVEKFQHLKPSLVDIVANKIDLDKVISSQEDISAVAELRSSLEIISTLQAELETIAPQIEKLVALVEQYDLETVSNFAPLISELPALVSEYNPRDNATRSTNNDARLTTIESHLTWTAEVMSNKTLSVSYEAHGRAPSEEIEEVNVTFLATLIGPTNKPIRFDYWAGSRQLIPSPEAPRFILKSEDEGDAYGRLLRNARKALTNQRGANPDVELDPDVRVIVGFRFASEDDEDPYRVAETTLDADKIFGPLNDEEKGGE